MIRRDEFTNQTLNELLKLNTSTTTSKTLRGGSQTGETTLKLTTSVSSTTLEATTPKPAKKSNSVSTSKSKTPKPAVISKKAELVTVSSSQNKNVTVEKSTAMENYSLGEDLVHLAAKLYRASSETESYEDSLIINSAYKQVEFLCVHYIHYLNLVESFGAFTITSAY